MLIGGLLTLLGTVLNTAAQNRAMLYCARVFLGIGVGERAPWLCTGEGNRPTAVHCTSAALCCSVSCRCLACQLQYQYPG